VVHAFEAAKSRGIKTIALLGRDGGDLRPLADVAIVVPSSDTQRIQEVHGVIVHLLADLVERRLIDADWFDAGTKAPPQTAWLEDASPRDRRAGDKVRASAAASAGMPR
jgi:hypothetical protein